MLAVELVLYRYQLLERSAKCNKDNMFSQSYVNISAHDTHGFGFECSERVRGSISRSQLSSRA